MVSKRNTFDQHNLYSNFRLISRMSIYLQFFLAFFFNTCSIVQSLYGVIKVVLMTILTTITPRTTKNATYIVGIWNWKTNKVCGPKNLITVNKTDLYVKHVAFQNRCLRYYHYETTCNLNETVYLKWFVLLNTKLFASFPRILF